MNLYQDDTWSKLYKFPTNYFDHIICDPPYDCLCLPIDEMKRVCSGNILCFCAPENQYYKPDEYLFWIKTSSTKNYRYKVGRFVEMILVLRRPNERESTFNQLYWSQMTGVYDDRIIIKQEHPFEKPISLMERLVRIYTNEGDNVLDCFMGSGSTGIACNNLGRNFTGIEYDQKWFDLAKRNLNYEDQK